jgi:ABC-type phosphate transport system substrate-binding protein
MTYLGHLVRRSFLLFLIVVAVSLPSQAGDTIVLLINARNPTAELSRGEVTNYFTGKTAFWHGVVPVKVVTRPGSSPAGKAFYEPVLSMTPQAFEQHWSKLQLAGKGVTPVTLGGAGEVAAVVAKTPGAIGFVLASEAWQLDGVKIIPLR